MRNLGILILVAGLALGLYAITMDVSVNVAARDFGYGIQTPAMEVANLDKLSQRQNIMIFAGVLSVVGAILLGFGSIQTRQQSSVIDNKGPLTSPQRDSDSSDRLAASNSQGSYSICPKCHHMGSGEDTECTRCGANFAS